jgi:2-keto-4-pentenoate hydratase/2-oxohepta-3-ene-1,7-dioic acid hydratase in catechol pathway
MKLCRFVLRASSDDRMRCGQLAGDQVIELDDLFASRRPTGPRWPIESVRLLAPCAPSKIICLARNYGRHAAELGNPVPQHPLIFLKAPSSVIGPDEPILLPPESSRVDYEGELAVVIGRTCARLGAQQPIEEYIAGFTCLNDVTARDLQKADGLFGRAKSFDTFCPLGPVLVPDLDWRKAVVETYVNGELRQRGATTDMLFPVDELVRWISRIMTLLPGDVIATGTPEGVGPLAPGDVVEIRIEGVGVLRNPVQAREAA